MHSPGDVVRRLHAVDALRGLVMIIMALDHTRDFFHVGAMSQSPTDLATTTPILFATRWITHVCAPVFMLLAGTSARLWLSRPGRTRGGLSRFLFTRGLALIVVEVIVMRLAFDLSFGLGSPVLLITLFALGGSMIVLAALVHLPRGPLAMLAMVTILLHNALDPVRAEQLGVLAPLWTLLHQPGAIVLGGPVLVVGYPLVPWFAVMALGYCMGDWMLEPPSVWRRKVARAGLVLTAAFVLLRAVNLYGDPSPWSAQASPSFTVLSFLNTTKYPASLAFLLMTLGPALLVLAAFGARAFRPGNPLIVYGRVPLFYYVVHFFLLHLLLVVAILVRYGASSQAFLLLPPPSMGGDKSLFPGGFGWSLGTTYLMWGLAVTLMYPACRWYGARRARGTSRLFTYF